MTARERLTLYVDKAIANLSDARFAAAEALDDDALELAQMAWTKAAALKCYLRETEPDDAAENARRDADAELDHARAVANEYE